MEGAEKPVDHLDRGQIRHERRGKPRLSCTFPAIVRGADPGGPRFQTTGAVENLSASGVFLRLERPIEQGSRLFIMFRFSVGAPDGGTGPNIAVHGIVLRTQEERNSHYRVAVRLQHYRFL